MRHRSIFLFLLLAIFVRVRVIDSAEPPTHPPVEPYADVVLKDRPVVFLRFDDARFETDPKSIGSGVIAAGIPNRLYDEDDLNDASAESKGFVRAAQPGPRPENFLAFESDNRCVTFDAPAVIKFKDPGEKSLLDFDLGDSITLEAWVSAKRLSDGQQIYVIGKGRTKNSGAADDNQNYALRLTGQNKSGSISFLFRNADNRPGKSEDFHRWNSKDGIPLDGSWHHIAVSYTFGEPKSIRGYIDGQPVEGTWDYGGATDKGPVVDDDELWIGSASGLNPGNSFHGSIDEVAIYRTALPAERVAARWQVLQPKPYLTEFTPVRDEVLVEIFEGIPDKAAWDFITPKPSESFVSDSFTLVEVPHKYTARGVRADRSNPFVVRVTGDVTLPPGECRILIRSRNASRLFIDGKLAVQNPFQSHRGDGHNDVWELDRVPAAGHRALRPGDQDTIASFNSNGLKHRVTWETYLGGKGLRPELGETFIAVQHPDSKTFQVLHPPKPFPLTDEAWEQFVETRRNELRTINQQRRAASSRDWSAYWDRRHELARKFVADRNVVAEPLRESDSSVLAKKNNLGRGETELRIESTDDWQFLRRVSLDTVGTIPSAKLIDEFFALPIESRRAKIIDRLLADPGWADHWVGYWQDVLAENPNILNPTLNNTGPFRWWIYESFLDNKPFDQFATELILMDGSERFGGAAGFGTASQNDVPMAAKAHIVGQAFLGLEMKCARCHDAPYHDFQQHDLFSFAALLKREPIALPKTSTVPAGTLTNLGREPLVKVTLKPGESIPPAWPFAKLIDTVADELLQNKADSRERLAAFVTSPNNRRFAQVIVNRVWARLLGRGLVEPIDDWDSADRKPSNPEVLEFLERELLTHNYDLKHIARLILNSATYDSVRGAALKQLPTDVNTPPQAGDSNGELPNRRLTAEQLVDSLFVAAGKPFHVEEMNIDVDGGRKLDVSISLGIPRRAWQFTSMSNERDRPSLSLPAAQNFVDVLEAFGWRPSRPDPVTVRSNETTVMQPAMLLNGVIGKRVSQLSDDSDFTQLAIQAKSPDEFIDSITKRILTRPATKTELTMFGELLQPGFADRIVPGDQPHRKPGPPRQTGVSWSNHLKPEANLRKQRLAEELAHGDPTTSRLNADWRERAEDMIWSLINSPEFQIVP